MSVQMSRQMSVHYGKCLYIIVLLGLYLSRHQAIPLVLIGYHLGVSRVFIYPPIPPHPPIYNSTALAYPTSPSLIIN